MPQNGIQKLRDPAFSRKTDGGVYRFRIDTFSCGTLVQQTERVPHAPLRKSRDQRGSVGFQLHLFPLGDGLQIGRNGVRLQAAEAVPLAAGKDRCRDLLQFRGGKNEHQVFGRFLQDLQQRVKGRRREHVDLVDDVHALLDNAGRKHRFLPQGADIIHAVIGGGVQLHHVQDAAVQDPPAGRAVTAGVPVRGMLAVDRPCQDPGAGGLPGAAGADKQVGVR